MNSIRPAAVAGTFYPGSEAALIRAVDGYLKDAAAKTVGTVRALIVPHAGYVYSGPIAASAYALLRELPEKPRRIALFGPSHFVGFRGLALPESDAQVTPMGVVPLDEELVKVATRFPQVFRADQAHAREHSLEVQLPFLQRLLPGVPVTPFAIGRASMEDVSAVMDAVSQVEGTLLVVSTDLSHYLTWDEARQLDRSTADAVTSLAPEKIESDHACGATGLRGLLHFARKKGMRTELLDLRNSGDTEGDRSRVVGYGAFAVFEGGAR